MRFVRSCAVFHCTDNVWRTGLTSRSCKKRFSCTWDSLSILELSSLTSESSCGTNRLYRLDVEPSGNASSPTVTAQVAGISESLPCSSTWISVNISITTFPTPLISFDRSPSLVLNKIWKRWKCWVNASVFRRKNICKNPEKTWK